MNDENGNGGSAPSSGENPEGVGSYTQEGAPLSPHAVSPRITPIDPPISPPADPTSFHQQEEEEEGEEDSANDTLWRVFDTEMLLNEVTIADVKLSLEFIEALENASHEGTGMDVAVLDRLRNPPTEPLDLSDPDLRFSIDIYIGLEQSSQETYRWMKSAVERRYPSSSLLSFESCRQKTIELSGVSTLANDMCPGTCIAYTGPFADLDRCSSEECQQPRFETKVTSQGRQEEVPRKKFMTIPIGPQMQAAFRHPDSAYNMSYRERKTAEVLSSGGQPEVYDDYIQGSDYLDLVKNGVIGPKDIVLMFSIDGAQLYQNKASDVWIYIWIILNLPPNLRYKKEYILPGGFIPGPDHPGNIESFLLPGLQHLAALQKEGLRIWDASTGETYTSYPFLFMVTADGPAMASLSGLVGHHGKAGCRLYCGALGRNKPRGSQYYPALMKPRDYPPDRETHDTIEVVKIAKPSAHDYPVNLRRLCLSQTGAEFRSNRLDTGIAKPSIFLGLPESGILKLPLCFPLDIMHLISLNLSDLFIGLWHGTIDIDKADDIDDWDWATLKGENWKKHGAVVAKTRSFWPSSFDRTPRNPAEKINSGYKAMEFLNYIFGAGPAVFLYFLPQLYYQHFCKLVQGVRILQQKRITREQIERANFLLLQCEAEFEAIYYQQRTSRIHFVRQSIHLLTHLAWETRRLGPLATCSQWPMERTIGNLGQEVKQHVNPFANLSERGARRCRVNSLIAMFPDLDPAPPSLPRGAVDLGDGFALLRARDPLPYSLSDTEKQAIKTFLLNYSARPDVNANISELADNLARKVDKTNCTIFRWARVRLPSGQVARSLWKEVKENARRSRNVKVSLSLIFWFHFLMAVKDRS